VNTKVFILTPVIGAVLFRRLFYFIGRSQKQRYNKCIRYGTLQTFTWTQNSMNMLRNLHLNFLLI